ncbi:Tetratricopeptide repeat protein [Desulfarculales bacterium]
MPIKGPVLKGLALLPLLLLLAAALVRAGALDEVEIGAAMDDVASGLASHSRGDHTGAIKRYNQALDSNYLSVENRAVALNNRGNAQDDQGNPEAALEDYTQAMRLQPSFTEAYFNRSFVLYKLGRYDDARHDLDRVIALAPELAPAYFNRSFVMLQKGLVARAIADVDKAVQLEPSNRKYRQHLEKLQAAEAKNPLQETKPPAATPTSNYSDAPLAR